MDDSCSVCGLANRKRSNSGGKQTRIKNGRETAANAFPWHVGVARAGRESRAFCGGTVINTRSVVTAAHCQRGGFGKFNLIVMDNAT